MSNILEIYERYKIMPSLADHQLRVASIADLISSYFPEILDKRSLVLACLFHDMGNIIKSDLRKFPDFLQPKGFDYWQKIKDDFVKKYGDDVHLATIKIAKELNLPFNTQKIIQDFGFGHIKEIHERGSLEQKVASYSDMRVGPLGVVTLKDRLKDLEERYGKVIIEKYSKEDFKTVSKALFELEKEIFSKMSIKPENINDSSISDIKNALLTTNF